MWVSGSRFGTLPPYFEETECVGTVAVPFCQITPPASVFFSPMLSGRSKKKCSNWQLPYPGVFLNVTMRCDCVHVSECVVSVLGFVVFLIEKNESFFPWRTFFAEWTSSLETLWNFWWANSEVREKKRKKVLKMNLVVLFLLSRTFFRIQLWSQIQSVNCLA